jgi:hypothetical protein
MRKTNNNLQATRSDYDINNECATSAVAWPAIFGGAFGAIAVSLMLLIFGASLGLASVSPMSEANPSPMIFTIITVIWMIIVQWIASGFGGYLTGRLRAKFTGMHGDEVFFRDTAHGFLSWAVATLITVTFLASTMASVAGAGVTAASAVAGGAAAGAASQAEDDRGDSDNYVLDTLFRSDRASAGNSEETRGETARILANGIMSDQFPPEDRAYLAKVVARQANVSQAEATERVNKVIAQGQDAKAQAKKAVNDARKAGAFLSLFTFLSMLVGAFIASVAAALGGRERDTY